MFTKNCDGSKGLMIAVFKQIKISIFYLINNHSYQTIKYLVLIYNFEKKNQIAIQKTISFFHETYDYLYKGPFHDRGTKKKIFNLKKFPKDNFGILFYLHHYNCNGL